ncbi:MAG: metal-sensitive transcriptional regulator [Ardenticatenaceae bacterium]|nr:metal-sensitive transcriptional regulator [Ardenticatenaceae bacterium]
MAVKEDLQVRLRRIEGQTRGVQRMLDEERDCREIIQQLNAIRSALQNATTLFVHTYAKECLLQGEVGTAVEREQLVDELLDLINKAS